MTTARPVRSTTSATSRCRKPDHRRDGTAAPAATPERFNQEGELRLPLLAFSHRERREPAGWSHFPVTLSAYAGTASIPAKRRGRRAARIQPGSRRGSTPVRTPHAAMTAAPARCVSDRCGVEDGATRSLLVAEGRGDGGESGEAHTGLPRSQRGAPPGQSRYVPERARSNRSRFMTLAQAAAKSCTYFSSPSSAA